MNSYALIKAHFPLSNPVIYFSQIIIIFIIFIFS